MTIDPITNLLAGDFRLAETGKRIKCPIRALTFEHNLDGHERDLLHDLDFPKSPAIVCDSNTYDVLAKRVFAALPNAKLVVIETPKADEATVKQLAYQTRHAEAMVAVGAGTLNDVAKYVSHRRRQPYAVFATAPSMNGYVTATASISLGGEKLSLPATPPQGAFFDLTILANAPYRMIRAGVGDSLCRSTAEFDWLLSHHLFDTAFLQTPFLIQAKDEADVLTQIRDLRMGNLNAVGSLARLLVLGGLGMLIADNSQPGSQGEHLISHYIDMMHRPHPGSLHGEQVGLATMTLSALQNEILTRDAPPLLAGTAIDPVAMAKRFGAHSSSCQKALARKSIKGDRLEILNQRLATRWPDIRDAFRARALSLEHLRAAFGAIGIPIDPQDLGISPSFYREAILHARELRDRFTVLDLAADAGILDSFVERYLAENIG
ncbi:MAG: iron-containing alcohol dehydrogenase [Geminicoccaceae bacterium]